MTDRTERFNAPILAFALSCLCALFQNANARGADLRIATGAGDGAYFTIGSALKESLERGTHLSVDILKTDGSLDNINQVRTHKAEFGLIQGAMQVDLSGLSAVAKVSMQYVHVIAPSQSSVSSLRELAGKRIGLGPEGSGDSAMGNLVLNFCNYNPAPIRVHQQWDEIESQMDSGKIDAAFLVFGLHARYIDAMLASGEYKLIPIDESLAISNYIPGVFAKRIPNHSYGPNRSIPGEFENGLPTLAVSTLLITRPDVPSRHVRSVLEALYNVETIKASRLIGLTESSGRQIVDLPLHKTADDFYARNDPITADAFEIGSFFIAGLFMLISSIFWFTNFFRRRTIERKRKAIVPHFEQMMSFGESVEKTKDINKLITLIEEMMSSQRNAEKRWLEGKLDTEHMENLYLVYDIRSRNAFTKILKIQNAELIKRTRELIAIASTQGNNEE